MMAKKWKKKGLQTTGSVKQVSTVILQQLQTMDYNQNSDEALSSHQRQRGFVEVCLTSASSSILVMVRDLRPFTGSRSTYAGNSSGSFACSCQDQKEQVFILEEETRQLLNNI